jgi:hypothetical protein
MCTFQRTVVKLGAPDEKLKNWNKLPQVKVIQITKGGRNEIRRQEMKFSRIMEYKKGECKKIMKTPMGKI